MKKTLTILFSLLYVICFGQVTSIDTVQSVRLIYNSSMGRLVIDFEESLHANIKLDLNKYPNLNSIEIFKYKRENKSRIIGLSGINLEEFKFSYSSFTTFALYNELPKNIMKFSIWKYPVNAKDTLFVPMELAQWTNLKRVSIGCCGLISLRKIDLSKLSKLDTFILEGPLVEFNELAKLKGLPYLGIDIGDWSIENKRKILHKLLPNTIKEPWCFSPNQQVLLFNGKTKSIQHTVKGDTLLSYNFISKSFVPSVVMEVITHNESYYPLCNVYALDNVTASADIANIGKARSVVATVNHPIISVNGSKIPLIDIDIKDSVFYENNNILEKIQVEQKQCYYEKTKVYNLLTTEKNYFVNGYLFADK